MLEMCVDETLSKTEGLSNRDKITLHWECNDSLAEDGFNAKLKYSDIEYTVSGLDEIAKEDLFDYIDVKIEGISPHGTVSVGWKNPNSTMWWDVDLEADQTSGLKNGDIVTVRANLKNPDAFMKTFGFMQTLLQTGWTK